MKRFINISATALSRTMRLATLLLLSAASAGCIYDNDLPYDPTRSAETVTMRFNIVTHDSRPSLRAVGEEAALDIENRIAADDMKFLLFSAEGDLLQDISSIARTQNDDTTYSAYTMQATFEEPYFTEGGADDTISFQIMVLANWPKNAVAQIGLLTNIDDILASAATYDMADDFWPTFDDKQSVGIPMYALRSFRVTRQQLRQSSANYPLVFEGSESITLLRAMAKFEIADKIEGKNDDGYPKVGSAVVLGWNSRGMLIPNNFENGKQVTAPTYPANPSPRSETDERYGRRMRQLDYAAHKGWTTYLPEMSLLSPTRSLSITIENYAEGGKPHYTGEKRTKTYTVAIPTGEEWSHMLRNHIYRIEVTSAKGGFTFNYTICPWDSKSADDITFD